MQCYKLVVNGRDKALALGQGMWILIFGLVSFWYLVIENPSDPVVQDSLPVIVLIWIVIVFVCWPVVSIDALTKRICITDQGIRLVSVINRRVEPWISWEELVGVDVQSNPRYASGIKQAVVHGQTEIHGLGGAYRKTRYIVIPGHHPDIQLILASIREYVGDKSLG